LRWAGLELNRAGSTDHTAGHTVHSDLVTHFGRQQRLAVLVNLHSTSGPACLSSALSIVAVTVTSRPGLSWPPSADQKPELSRPSLDAISIVGTDRNPGSVLTGFGMQPPCKLNPFGDYLSQWIDMGTARILEQRCNGVYLRDSGIPSSVTRDNPRITLSYWPRIMSC
jgi:hypothetical protein